MPVIVSYNKLEVKKLNLYLLRRLTALYGMDCELVVIDSMMDGQTA